MILEHLQNIQEHIVIRDVIGIANELVERYQDKDIGQLAEKGKKRIEKEWVREKEKREKEEERSRRREEKMRVKEEREREEREKYEAEEGEKGEKGRQHKRQRGTQFWISSTKISKVAKNEMSALCGCCGRSRRLLRGLGPSAAVKPNQIKTPQIETPGSQVETWEEGGRSDVFDTVYSLNLSDFD